MRYLRVTGIVASLCVLLCGMALQMDELVRLSLLINAGAVVLCFLAQPAPRATLAAAVLSILGSAIVLLEGQGSGSFVTVPSALGDKIVPAGESAYRTVGACMFALFTGASIGETAFEGALVRSAFGGRSGWAGAPVRICAVLCLLAGIAACLLPGLSGYIALPASVSTVSGMFTALAFGAVVCYAAAARSKAAALIVQVLYMAGAVFDPPLFARHAFFAMVFSVLLCAKARGREAIACLVPGPALRAALWYFRADPSVIGQYAAQLWPAVVDFARPGGLEWMLFIYARFGIWGFAAVGFAAGAMLFLLGRLLRDSFLYSAPVLCALGWSCLVLFKGTGAMPAVTDIVFFGVPYGLCLIVGCIRRANAKHR